MKTRSLILALIILGAVNVAASGQEFDPKVDGWYFENWGEQSPHCVGSCDLSWDLYRQTYLGINPTNNCVEAPLDCGFYEIFKSCGKNGNCGGMSLLALALFKYGGYLGFCSPASFYTGTKSPDRSDLHQAINILQGRQFSASGIENFIDVVDAGDLNDAVAAFHTVRDALARGDYPVLSIANSALGDLAHTVIPYKVEDGPGGGYPKKMYIWDSVLPYDDHATHYDTNANYMTINSSTDWTYVQSPSRTYSGSGGTGAWCFAIPMSIVLPKSRQPLALDMVFDALQSVFVTGPGAAASQVSDDEGHRFYKTDTDVHVLGSDLETDPAKRLKGVVRWRWPSQAGRVEPPGELYFIRRTIGGGDALNFTISGKEYRALIGVAGNLIQIDGKSADRAKDLIRVSNLATAAQSVDIQTLGAERNLSVKQLRADVKGKDWRSIEVRDLRAARNVPVTIGAVGDMESVLVSSRDQAVNFDLDLQQRVMGQFATRKTERLSTTPGKLLRIAPGDWSALDRTEIEKEHLDRIAPGMVGVTALKPPVSRELPPAVATTVAAGEFYRITDLEFKVEGAKFTDSPIRDEPPPDGYQYVVFTLAMRNPQSSEARFADSDYVARLYTSTGEETRWNGVFLGERGDTGMSVMDVKPGATLVLRVYYVVPKGTALGKFVFAAKSSGKSYTFDVSGQ